MFTGLMLFTIGLGLAIGFAEVIIFLIATDQDVTKNKKAQTFIFYGCGLPLGVVSAVQNYVEWVSALLLAHKYHIVSLTIEWITQTGNFLPLKTQKKVFWLYIGVAVACAAFVLIEESLIWTFTVQANKSSLIKTETMNSVLSITFLTILTLLFAYSYIKITRTLTKADLNMSINKTLLTINFSLLLIILLTWII